MAPRRLEQTQPWYGPTSPREAEAAGGAVEKLVSAAAAENDTAGLSRILARRKTVRRKLPHRGNRIVFGDEEALNFASYSYLGFECHPLVVEASTRALERYGWTTGASRLFHEPAMLARLEKEVAYAARAPAALVTLNVTAVNLSVIPALASGRDSVVVMDLLAHATMRAGVRMAIGQGAHSVRTDARDLDRLEVTLARLFQERRYRRRILVVDGLYSMQGHVLDLPAIEELCRRYNTVLYIDDAHGFGVYGDSGGGVVEEFGLSYDGLVYVGSLLKGLGTNGGFVAGHAELIEHLRRVALGFVFSDPISPAAVAAAGAALSLSRSSEGRRRRKRLRRYSRLIRQELREIGFDVPEGDSPIIPIPIGDDERVLAAQEFLLERGIYVNPVVFPGVPRGSGILRVSVNGNHTEAGVASLVDACRELWELL